MSLLLLSSSSSSLLILLLLLLLCNMNISQNIFFKCLEEHGPLSQGTCQAGYTNLGLVNVLYHNTVLTDMGSL